jgi:hypothetical protein
MRSTPRQRACKWRRPDRNYACCGEVRCTTKVLRTPTVGVALVAELTKWWAMVRRTVWPTSCGTGKVLHWPRSKPAVHVLVMHVRLRLILWRQSIGTDLEGACLPCKAVEAINSTSGVFSATHEYIAVPTTAVIGSKTDIGTEHRSSLAEEVLKVLPPNTIRELRVSEQSMLNNYISHEEIDATIRSNRRWQDVGHERCKGASRGCHVSRSVPGAVTGR